MMILITYDVSTVTGDGKKRLRQVSKVCVNYGQRVQNSVFECNIEPAMYVEIKHQLSQIIDHERDSLRFYRLGKNWQGRVEMIGKNNTYDPEKDVFIL
ncbi:CRISPR-associated endonuclease Cas2 [Acetobacterium sp. K1/6]|jgi:CRISPR-associated protein Cas2|uniref:CRISPR-associated endonuclease Cas2 n=1 Tax=Acetobacterium sp. K1/6 TaxID=3055467 RepID=UPI002ACA0514|nr:CRISPR-associated endonuclease Cas2 [Acetobacterium sp. K1/6]MDZ5725814.1 CRISPR-associated endonuclease Cas2 [Acetobacterium sp. K1/6]